MPEASAPIAAIAESGLNRRAVLAASAPWLGALLNVLPGLGTGYLYQRRWLAWWTTAALVSAWFLLGSRLAPKASVADPRTALLGVGGLLLLSAITTAEAFLTARRARMD